MDEWARGRQADDLPPDEAIEENLRPLEWTS